MPSPLLSAAAPLSVNNLASHFTVELGKGMLLVFKPINPLFPLFLPFPSVFLSFLTHNPSMISPPFSLHNFCLDTAPSALTVLLLPLFENPPRLTLPLLICLLFSPSSLNFLKEITILCLSSLKFHSLLSPLQYDFGPRHPVRTALTRVSICLKSIKIHSLLDLFTAFEMTDHCLLLKGPVLLASITIFLCFLPAILFTTS